MEYFKIVLENGEVVVSNDILKNIPFTKDLIDKNQFNVINNVPIIYLHGINPTIFSHIVTLIKICLSNPVDKTIKVNFIKNMNVSTLFDFILVCNKLGLDEFKNLGVNKFRDVFDNNSVEGIRETLKIQNDFTEEEQINIDKDNEWNLINE